MSIADAYKPESDVQPPAKLPEAVPRDIDDRLRRGRTAMLKDANLRRCCVKFWEGEHYWYVNGRGQLNQLPASLFAVEAGKPLHRIRNTYNFAASIIEGKVSAATQRVPGYEVTPSTDDPDDEAAASLASQVLIFGFDAWRVSRHTKKAVTNALVQREGFVMPYFDPNVGPYELMPDGTNRGKGDIRLLNLTRSEVMWEPGMDFDDSPWYGVERAMLVEEIKRIPGFVGGEVKADAATSDVPEGKRSDKMARLTEYLERPCPKYPEGRRCFITGERIIVDYRLADPDALDWYESYPFMDAQGLVADEPVIHRISYTINPEGDDLGLMERLIDLTRTIDDCWNKLLEWKNRALNPRGKAPRGSNVTAQSDAPGGITYYNPVAGGGFEWEQTPAIPRELFDMLDLAIGHMRSLAADIDVQPDPGLAAKTANAAIESNQARWQSFLGDLGEFHGRLGRHMLCLVAANFDTQRLIDIRGQYGWEPVADFTGQDLRSQVNVRVLPGSIESKSRQSIQQEIEFIQTNWPGAISPEAALATLHGGSAEGLIRSYQNDVAKIRRLIRALRKGPEAMLSYAPRFDPNVQWLNPYTGEVSNFVPGWMPKPQDNITIWRHVLGDYMKTEDYESHPIETQHLFDQVWAGLDFSEQQRAAQQAAQQQMMAQSLGMSNAAAPQTPPPLPDKAGFTPENSSPAPAPPS